MNGQYIYASLAEVDEELYAARILLDDDKADHRAHFKDITLKKIKDAMLSSSEDSAGLLDASLSDDGIPSAALAAEAVEVGPPGTSPSSAINIQRLIEIVNPEAAGSQENADGIRFSVAPPVESEAFKRWFGDSKVVDEDGKPLVVYHGTGRAFNTFDRNKSNDRIGRLMGLGAGKGKFYFTQSEFGAKMAAAGAVATGRGNFPRVMAVYLHAEKIMDRIEYDDKLQNFYKEQAKGSPKNENYDYQVRDRLIAKLDRELKSSGYDGVWDRESGEIFVFSPNQIKSATDNVGTFDPNNPDIRFSLAEYFDTNEA